MDKREIDTRGKGDMKLDFLSGATMSYCRRVNCCRRSPAKNNLTEVESRLFFHCEHRDRFPKFGGTVICQCRISALQVRVTY